MYLVDMKIFIYILNCVIACIWFRSGLKVKKFKSILTKNYVSTGLDILFIPSCYLGKDSLLNVSHMTNILREGGKHSN